MTKQVKLFNKGKSTILGHHPDAVDEKTGLRRPYSFKPETTRSFCEAEAAKLRKLYPNQIVNLEDEVKKFDDEEVAAPPTMISIEEANKVKQDAINAAVKEAMAKRDKEDAKEANKVKQAGDAAQVKNEGGEPEEESEAETDEEGAKDKATRGRGRPSTKAA